MDGLMFKNFNEIFSKLQNIEEKIESSSGGGVRNHLF